MLERRLRGAGRYFLDEDLPEDFFVEDFLAPDLEPPLLPAFFVEEDVPFFEVAFAAEPPDDFFAVVLLLEPVDFEADDLLLPPDFFAEDLVPEDFDAPDCVPPEVFVAIRSLFSFLA